jgi:hypothetical protein
MLLNTRGELRTNAEMVKAETIMTKQEVKNNILRYNKSYWVGKFAHNRKTTTEKMQ